MFWEPEEGTIQHSEGSEYIARSNIYDIVKHSGSRTIWGQKRVKRTNTEAVKHVIIIVSNSLVIWYLM